MNVILDIEANDLLERVTELHCFVLRDADSGELIGSYADQPGYPSISEGLKVLQQADLVWGHNIIRYDRPALNKLTKNLIPWEKIRDTLIIAQMRWTNLKATDVNLVAKGKLPPDCLGKHTLKAWGYRLGRHKGTFGETNDFSKWTPEMQVYCEQDTLVTYDLIQHLRKAGFSDLAVETEQELAEYLRHQEDNGWPFNLEKAVALQGKLAARREQLTVELQAIFGSWYKKGKEFVPKKDNRKMGYVAGCPLTKVERITFNPGSTQHIVDRLTKLYDWKPSKFTEKGSPQMDEEVMLELPQHIPGVKLLTEYQVIKKLLGMLSEGKNAWLKMIDKDRPRGGKLTGMHHVHHQCLQSGTITHRASHIKPNLAQVPKVGKPFGQECRELFHVPKGWVQIGADASGLELRELSHYMARYDGGAYGKTVTEGKNEDGTDVHSQNRNALGLAGKQGRDDAKTFIYAFLYGSGDLNLGHLIPPSLEEIEEFRKNKRKWASAKELLANRNIPTDAYTVACALKGGLLKSRFTKNLPALGKLLDAVKNAAKEKGYLVLHDGRRVPIRHAHAALNSLLQGSGAVVCKRWIVRFNRRLVREFGTQGWDGQWAAMGWIHDEVQLAVRPEIAERVSQILIEEIREVALEFNLRCPLDGEAKTGDSWAACH